MPAALPQLPTLCLHPALPPRAQFNTGGLSEREALEAAVATWPADVRPVVHWSESQVGVEGGGAPPPLLPDPPAPCLQKESHF